MHDDDCRSNLVEERGQVVGRVVCATNERGLGIMNKLRRVVIKGAKRKTLIWPRNSKGWTKQEIHPGSLARIHLEATGRQQRDVLLSDRLIDQGRIKLDRPRPA